MPDPERRTGYDKAERARLRAAVLDPVSCPYDDGTCSATTPVRHVVGEDEGQAHWVRCHLYAPAREIAHRALQGTDTPEAETTAA
ncbi:hypothetical protein [Streptomyces sp. NPDC093105]|uniref:hypothetical protein n=1 Tax=Streptomyces sp. NPDC093105 TaxID=3366029 RepID=UPI00381B0D13